MSWGATGFTPIVTNNQPPFGFAEVITPPDFKTNPTDPWSTTEDLKAELNAKFDMKSLDLDPTQPTLNIREEFRPQKDISAWMLIALIILITSLCIHWR
jgi:hypothetical protein